MAREVKTRALTYKRVAFRESGPRLAALLLGSVWQWMILLSGAAAAHCAYSYLLAAEWERQLRAFRGEWTLARRREHEREALLARMTADQPAICGPVGWALSPESLAAGPGSH